MDATKPYEFIWFGAMDATKPHEFIGFGAAKQKPFIICLRPGASRGRVPEFLSVFEVLGRFLSVSGQVSYPLGPILKSAFLWRCFC